VEYKLDCFVIFVAPHISLIMIVNLASTLGFVTIQIFSFHVWPFAFMF